MFTPFSPAFWTMFFGLMWAVFSWCRHRSFSPATTLGPA